MSKISILCWNIACLPKPWNSFATKNPADRKAPLLLYIKNVYPDIICLQEVFDSGVSNYLIRGLQTYGYEVVTSDEEGSGCCAPGCLKSLGIGFRGGLLIAYKSARFEKVVSYFYKYSSSTGEDKFAGKGVLYTRLYSDKTRSVDVFNTHLQANATYFCAGNGEAVRVKQLNELETWLKKTQGGETTIVAGDFNISPSHSEFPILETMMNEMYMYGHLPISSRPTASWGKQVDYIFYFPKRNQGKTNNSLSEIYITNLSDHYALLEEYNTDNL